jgi:hypothetical protein
MVGQPMTDTAELSRRIEAIESGYEFLLAYAAQGRRDDAGSDVRKALTDMHAALEGLGFVIRSAAGAAAAQADSNVFITAAGEDAQRARGAIALVLLQNPISSLLVDNLNASVHLRALLTDLFLIDQALKKPV